MKLIVELIRHGETELQAQRRYQGVIDVPLSSEGRRKLAAGKRALAAGSEPLIAGSEPFAAGRGPLTAGSEPSAAGRGPLTAGRGSSTAESGVPAAEERIPTRKNEFRSPEVVYVSPLKRAGETASILFPGAAQVVITGLSEMNFGKFEGRNFREMENDPEYRSWVDSMCLGKCPGGESREEFCIRTCEAFLEVLRRTVCKEPEPACGTEAEGPRVVIVAHGGTQMAVLNRFYCPPEKQEERAGNDKAGAEERTGRGTDRSSTDRSSTDRNSTDDRSSTDNYYSWQLPCGQGYVLEVWTDGTECRIHVLGIRDYCAPEE